MKIILIISFFLLFAGCKSKRELFYHSELKQDIERQNDVYEHEIRSRDSTGKKVTEVVGHKESDTETETIIRTTEYDTSMPVNPETGKPPILRETESTIMINKKDRENTSDKAAENSNVSDQFAKDKIDQSSNIQTTDKTEDMEQAKTTDVLKIPWGWVIVGVLGVIFVCIRKKVNLFNWILRL